MLSADVVLARASASSASLLEDDVLAFVVGLDDIATMRLRQALAAAKIKAPAGWAQVVANRQRERAKTRGVTLGSRTFERGDHVEIAEALISRLREAAPVIADMGDLYSYSHPTGVWGPVQEASASRIVQSFAGSFVVHGKPPILKVRASDVDGSIRLAKHAVDRPEFFANAPAGLAFYDVFVRLHGARIVTEPHHPEHAARFCYDFAYDPAAPCARWLGFLDAAFRGDKDAADKIELIQEFAGAALVGMATKYQRCVIFTGDGANGKSTCAEILEAGFPAGSTSAISPQKLGENYMLHQIAGKLLNVALELAEDEILAPGSFKGIIDGMKMTARDIRESPYDFKPRAGHLYAANRLPGTTDHTHGFWRRWLVVEFNRIFRAEEQNVHLKDEIISTELQGIVAWLLEGARRLAERGRYKVPESSGQAVERWRHSADPVAIFVSERAVMAATDEERTGASYLFTEYVAWAEKFKFRAMSITKFGQRMRGLGFASQHTRTGQVYPVRIRREGEPYVYEEPPVGEAELAEAARQEALAAADESAAEDAWRTEQPG